MVIMNMMGSFTMSHFMGVVRLRCLSVCILGLRIDLYDSLS